MHALWAFLGAAHSADEHGHDRVDLHQAERRARQGRELLGEAARSGLERRELGFDVLDADLKLFTITQPELEGSHSATFVRRDRLPAEAKQAEPPPHRGSAWVWSFRERLAASGPSSFQGMWPSGGT